MLAALKGLGNNYIEQQSLDKHKHVNINWHIGRPIHRNSPSIGVLFALNIQVLQSVYSHVIIMNSHWNCTRFCALWWFSGGTGRHSVYCSGWYSRIFCKWRTQLLSCCFPDHVFASTKMILIIKLSKDYKCLWNRIPWASIPMYVATCFTPDFRYWYDAYPTPTGRKYLFNFWFVNPFSLLCVYYKHSSTELYGNLAEGQCNTVNQVIRHMKFCAIFLAVRGGYHIPVDLYGSTKTTTLLRVPQLLYAS